MLTRMLMNAVEADPTKLAVVQGARRINYAELAELAGRAATGLRQLGIGNGDCIAVVLPNGPEFVACLFACARVRAVMLPLHLEVPAEIAVRELASVLDRGLEQAEVLLDGVRKSGTSG